MIGKFKYESGIKIISDYVGLAAKMYSFKTTKKDENKTAKGVSYWEIMKNTKFDDYQKCLLTKKGMSHKMRTINRIVISCIQLNRLRNHSQYMTISVIF